MEKSRNMSTENRTQKTIRRKKRRKKRYLLRLIIIILVFMAVYYVAHLDYFTIDAVTVAGNKELSDEDVIKQSEIKVGESVFDVSMIMTERRIKKNLYIEDVDAKRIYPDRIDIVVVERVAMAQFPMGEKYVIIDGDGLVMDIVEKPIKTTLVKNIEVKAAEPGETIVVKDEKSYRAAMDFINAAEEGDLFFKKLEIDGKNVKAYVYDKLICKGRYTDMMKSIEMETLKAAIFNLYQDGKKSGVIKVGRNNYCSFTP